MLGTEIVDVRTRLYAAEATEAIAMSFAPMRRRAMAVVEIESAAGHVGRGESWINYPSWAGVERYATVQAGVAPLLRGQDSAAVETLHGRLVAQLEPLGRQWGARGPIMQAISGADAALWDLRARHAGVSVAELLGGRARDDVPVYASSLGPTDVEATARRCLGSGFGMVKVKVGFGPDVDRENLRIARRVLGDEVTLVADANQAWSLAEAVAAADMLSEAGVAWIEEPIRGNALGDLEELVRRTGQRVATGENIYGLSEFLPYLESPDVAVLQPDVGKTGGITEVARICRKAATLGRTITPHLYGGVLSFAAALQLAAAFPVIDALEYDVRTNPFRDEVLTSPVTVVDGRVAIPAGIGLGVELSDDIHRWEVRWQDWLAGA